MIFIGLLPKLIIVLVKFEWSSSSDSKRVLSRITTISQRLFELFVALLFAEEEEEVEAEEESLDAWEEAEEELAVELE